jgi:PAS domain-containing protein
MVRRTVLAELFDAERLFADFFNSSNVGLAIFDQQLRYRMLNPCLAASNGTSADSHLGKHVREILGNVALQVEPAIQQVFATGRSVVNCEVAGALPNRLGGGHWMDNFFPMADSNGRVKQVGAVVVELERNIQLQRTHPNAWSTAAVLRSWKDIAQYVQACVKTVQRWEHAYNFPVRRLSPNNNRTLRVVWRASRRRQTVYDRFRRPNTGPHRVFKW